MNKNESSNSKWDDFLKNFVYASIAPVLTSVLLALFGLSKASELKNEIKAIQIENTKLVGKINQYEQLIDNKLDQMKYITIKQLICEEKCND